MLTARRACKVRQCCSITPTPDRDHEMIASLGIRSGDSDAWRRVRDVERGWKCMAERPAKRAMHPPFPIKDVQLDLVDLDLRNSRFPRDAQSQSDALELMMLTAGPDCLDLLRDVTRSGQM